MNRDDAAMRTKEGQPTDEFLRCLSDALSAVLALVVVAEVLQSLDGVHVVPCLVNDAFVAWI